VRDKGEHYMKCPKCGNDVMMVLCRRDSDSGFLNELYYKCLACGYSPKGELWSAKEEKDAHAGKPFSSKRLMVKNARLKFTAFAAMAIVGLAFVMQIPVPVRVFATEVSIDPVKDILPYISLVNFTLSDFSLNYSEGGYVLQVSAGSASVVSVEDENNVTTCVVNLGKVLITYQDSQRSFNMGFASLAMTIKVMYRELIAKIDASAYMPLWTAIIEKLTGQLP
jgi:predicted RNA-binding Zn-ribbon protein involved in translation (DUF1610 family)